MLESKCVVIHHAKLNPFGYLRLRINGKNKLVYKYLWEQENGPVPEGYQLHHQCRNTECINIDHLELMEAGEHTKLTNKERVGRRIQNVIDGKEKVPYGTLYYWKQQGYIDTFNRDWLRREYSA
jgi:hypothetical protein